MKAATLRKVSRGRIGSMAHWQPYPMNLANRDALHAGRFDGSADVLEREHPSGA